MVGEPFYNKQIGRLQRERKQFKTNTMDKFKEYQQEVNRACKGTVRRKGLGFLVSYSPEFLEADKASDITELHALGYEPVEQGKDKLFIPLYLSKYPS